MWCMNFHKCTDTYKAKVLRDQYSTNQNSISHCLTRWGCLFGICLKTEKNPLPFKGPCNFFLHTSLHMLSLLPNAHFCNTTPPPPPPPPEGYYASTQLHENSATQRDSAVMNHFVTHYMLWQVCSFLHCTTDLNLHSTNLPQCATSKAEQQWNILGMFLIFFCWQTPLLPWYLPMLLCKADYCK